MRSRAVTVLLAVLFAASVLPVQAQSPDDSKPLQPGARRGGGLDAAGRYIVLTARGADTKTVRNRHMQAQGVKPERFYGRAIRGFSAQLSGEQVKALREDPQVAAVVPDEIVELVGQVTPTGVARIGGTRSVIAKIDGKDQRVDADVAIVDTGIASHPDLNVAGGVNCTTSDRDAWGDQHGHGTHVAGTVGALDNGIGVVGVAPGVRLWSVRILNAEGFGYLSWYMCGLDWIAAQRHPGDPDRPLFEAVNMSVAKWGKDDFNCGYTDGDILHQAICRLVASGVTVAVAAGNDSGSAAARVPAAYDEVITVSALADLDGKPGGLGGPRCLSWGTFDSDDTFADFSNYGTDVDIIAPGKCIWSTMPGNRYEYMSGTSMATPAVAGAIALYKATRPWVSPGMVKGALQFLGSTNWKRTSDPDGRRDILLDVSRMGPGGDYTINMNPPVAVGEAGGKVVIPIRIERTPTHFETISLEATTPPGFPVALDRFTLTGWTAESAIVTVTVPPSTPAGSYPVTVVGRESGRHRSDTVNIVVENDPPTAFAPVAAPAYRVSLGATTAPLRIRWNKAVDAASAIAGYELEYSLDHGPWTPSGTVAGSATEAVRQVALNRNHRFRIRARDAAGNWSAWAEGVGLGLGVVDDKSTSIAWSSGWFRYTTTAASGGSTRYAYTRGAWMRVSKMARVLAFVAPVGPTRGSVQIYVNGVYQATVSTYSRTSAARQVLWVKDFGVDAARTIEIRVVGTSGRPRVDVDAILVGR